MSEQHIGRRFRSLRPSGPRSEDQRLEEYRITWERKPVLRAIYHDYYRRIVTNTKSGLTLEIGGGSGNLKQYLPDVFSTDLLPGSWLDARADAQHLPFRDATFDNIVLVDVLHHLVQPTRFFEESCRVLVDGGRIVMVEPAITVMSYPFYRWFHPEPVVLSDDPFDPQPSAANRRDPFDANQAIPTLLFGRYRSEFLRRFPCLGVTARHHLSLFAYPMSGGFRPWCLVPKVAVDAILATERLAERCLGRLLGFRLLVVLTRGSRGE